MPDLESFIRRTANRFGIDIHRYRPERTAPFQLATMLRTHGVDLVLDVGANTGQFATSLRQAGYRGRIVSFEPLSDAHAELVRQAQADSMWEIAPRCAIGQADGQVELNVSANSVSSSLLPMLRSHEDAAPDSSVIRKEGVPIRRLDSVAPEYMAQASVPFMKIDTQGFEDRVLDGAEECLGRLVGLQLELSFVPLYAGQCLFEPLLERLRGLGFTIWAIWSGLHDPGTGRMLQVDVALFRASTGADG
jgi:FkbM family methyltransferase